MIITRTHIENGRSRNGAFSEAQLNCLGLSYRRASGDYERVGKGWVKTLPGTDYPAGAIGLFVGLKDNHLKPILPSEDALVIRLQVAAENSTGVTSHLFEQAANEIQRLLELPA